MCTPRRFFPLNYRLVVDGGRLDRWAAEGLAVAAKMLEGVGGAAEADRSPRGGHDEPATGQRGGNARSRRRARRATRRLAGQRPAAAPAALEAAWLGALRHEAATPEARTEAGRAEGGCLEAGRAEVGAQLSEAVRAAIAARPSGPISVSLEAVPAADRGEGEGAEAVTPSPPAPLMVVEVTARIRGGQYFLRPDAKANEVILGIIGRAQAEVGVVIYALHVLSNHVGLLLGVQSVEQSGAFCNRIFGQLAVRVGALRGRIERIWQRRVRVIPVDGDPACLVDRLRYCLANSVAEHLVTHATRWPGVHSAKHLCLGAPMVGTWTDGTAWGRARRRRPGTPEAAYRLKYAVVHSKLPGLTHLSDAEYCALVRTWCAEDAAQAAAARVESRRRARQVGDPSLAIPEPGPPEAFVQVAATDAPESFEPTPAPLIHASPARRREYRALLKAYREALAANRARLLAQCRREGSDFPHEGLPPTGMPAWPARRWPAPLPLEVTPPT